MDSLPDISMPPTPPPSPELSMDVPIEEFEDSIFIKPIKKEEKLEPVEPESESDEEESEEEVQEEEQEIVEKVIDKKNVASFAKPWTCECGQILKSGLDRNIESHLASKQHQKKMDRLQAATKEVVVQKINVKRKVKKQPKSELTEEKLFEVFRKYDAEKERKAEEKRLSKLEEESKKLEEEKIKKINLIPEFGEYHNYF